jgi:hypothetical protein
VREYIHAVAEAYYADDPDKAMHWVESTMTRLSLKGGVSHVIGGLKRMQPQTEDVKEQIRKTTANLFSSASRFKRRSFGMNSWSF